MYSYSIKHTHTHTHLRVCESLLHFRPCEQQLHHEEHSHRLAHLKHKQPLNLLTPQLLVVHMTEFKGRVVSVQRHAVLVLYHQAAQNRDISTCTWLKLNVQFAIFDSFFLE